MFKIRGYFTRITFRSVKKASLPVLPEKISKLAKDLGANISNAKSSNRIVQGEIPTNCQPNTGVNAEGKSAIMNFRKGGNLMFHRSAPLPSWHCLCANLI